MSNLGQNLNNNGKANSKIKFIIYFFLSSLPFFGKRITIYYFIKVDYIRIAIYIILMS